MARSDGQGETKMDNETRIAFEQLQKLLADWPTMRALSALGAEKATANKLAARQIVERMLNGNVS